VLIASWCQNDAVLAPMWLAHPPALDALEYDASAVHAAPAQVHCTCVGSSLNVRRMQAAPQLSDMDLIHAGRAVTRMTDKATCAADVGSVQRSATMRLLDGRS
jgi:hydrogenase maturation factor